MLIRSERSHVARHGPKVDHHRFAKQAACVVRLVLLPRERGLLAHVPSSRNGSCVDAWHSCGRHAGPALSGFASPPPRCASPAGWVEWDGSSASAPHLFSLDVGIARVLACSHLSRLQELKSEPVLDVKLCTSIYHISSSTERVESTGGPTTFRNCFFCFYHGTVFLFLIPRRGDSKGLPVSNHITLETFALGLPRAYISFAKEMG